MKRTFLLTLTVSFLALTACSPDPNVRRGQATGGVATGLITDFWGGAAVDGLVDGEITRER